MRLGVWPFVGLFCLLRGCVALECGFVRSALFLAVGTYVVLSSEAMPGLCCFLRVTPQTLFALARQAFQQKHAELTITLAAPTYAASFKPNT